MNHHTQTDAPPHQRDPEQQHPDPEQRGDLDQQQDLSPEQRDDLVQQDQDLEQRGDLDQQDLPPEQRDDLVQQDLSPEQRDDLVQQDQDLEQPDLSAEQPDLDQQYQEVEQQLQDPERDLPAEHQELPPEQPAAATRPGTVEPPAELWPEDTVRSLQERWRDVQLRFVDDPPAAADDAERLLKETMDSFTAAVASHQAELDSWRRADGADTERMRIVVRRYRSLFDRLLAG
jgi:hypothetical protein